MSWLLDADVLSQPAKRHGDPRVTAWLETEQDDCYTSGNDKHFRRPGVKVFGGEGRGSGVEGKSLVPSHSSLDTAYLKPDT